MNKFYNVFSSSRTKSLQTHGGSGKISYILDVTQTPHKENCLNWTGNLHTSKNVYLWHLICRASNSQPKDTLNSQTMQNCLSNLTNNNPSCGILKCLRNDGMSPFQNSLSSNINSRWNNLNWPSVSSDMVLIDLSFSVWVLLCPGFSRQVTHIHLSE